MVEARTEECDPVEDMAADEGRGGENSSRS